MDMDELGWVEVPGDNNLAILLYRLHFLNKYLLSIYYIPNSILGTNDTAINKADKNFCLHGVYSLVIRNA